MFLFEDGEMESEAYVEINGTRYPVHMPKYKGNTPLTAENLNKAQINILKMAFPIGAPYITQDNTNPSEILKFGTWERLKGKVLVGLDEDDENFNEIGKKGGETEHTLTIEEMPRHIHNIDKNSGGIWTYGVNDAMIGNGTSGNWAQRADGDTQPAGGGKPHNNLQPYEVSGYMWIRRS